MKASQRIAFCLGVCVLFVARALPGDEGRFDRRERADSVRIDLSIEATERPAGAAEEPDLEKLAKAPIFDGRLPGEFEHQGALLLGCHELVDAVPEVFLQIVRETRGVIKILALVSNAHERAFALSLLRDAEIPHDHVLFSMVPHDTMWARDYGPLIAERKHAKAVVIDAGYALERAKDDRVPEEVARKLGLGLARMPLRVDGGNLLCNGAGLGLTTLRLLDDNGLGYGREAAVRKVMERGYGLKQLVVLEPLTGEPTGHVDMFATFTSPTTVVVGAYDPQVDPQNAAILDRNAACLGAVVTRRGRLRVVRVPMPARDDGVWRTYTNVTYANGLLMVPVYPGFDEAGLTQAMRTYARLLPRWRVVGLDATDLIESEGALHCVTMNLGPVKQIPQEKLPRVPRFEELGDLDIAKAAGDDDDWKPTRNRNFSTDGEPPMAAIRRETDLLGFLSP